jgi:hypothetical protein
MSTKYEFDSETIENFCNSNGVTITLTVDQVENLAVRGKTPLLVDQISNVADQLFPDEISFNNFIEQTSAEFDPLSLTLYVLNEDLWRIMFRKHEHPEKMLPMTTIPWFFWEKEAERRGNLSGIRRFDDPRHQFYIRIEEGILKIGGKGGDFAGLLEGRIVDRNQGIRPIFIPGSTGPKKAVPKYESKIIQIKMSTDSIKTELYPAPSKELDYFFSEHPRVFYEHGIQIESDGDYVNLKVGNRKETTLRGKVIIFIGKDFKDTQEIDKILKFHVWLTVLNRKLFP